MSNSDIVNRFLNSRSRDVGKPGWQLNIQGNRLFSYGEVIGEHINGGVCVHYSKHGKFSTTTSKHVTLLSNAAARSPLPIIEA